MCHKGEGQYGGSDYDVIHSSSSKSRKHFLLIFFAGSACIKLVFIQLNGSKDFIGKHSF